MFRLFRAAPPTPLATEADIRACFRLLLGRAPQAVEWPAHAGKIGRDLRAVVAGFTTSPEFAHRGLLPPPPHGAAAMADPVPQAPPTADAQDIFYCFRLILGRLPNREEWLGHATQIGNDLETVVAGYTNSLEFAHRGLATASAQGLPRLVEQDGFKIHVHDNDAAVGQHVAAGAYEPDVAGVFRHHLRPGMTVIDIGANIGYFTMLSAALVGPTGHVLAVEPNPRNARMLEASRQASNFAHVTICQAAAGRQTGLLVLNTTHSNGTTSAASGIEQLLQAETVACLRIDSLIDPPSRVDFIKVDVEGAEYNALLGCAQIIARDRPVIASEFSPDMIGSISGISGPDYLRWLIGCGYRLSVIGGDAAGMDVDQIMAAYAHCGTDHIDVLAMPA